MCRTRSERFVEFVGVCWSVTVSRSQSGVSDSFREVFLFVEFGVVWLCLTRFKRTSATIMEKEKKRNWASNSCELSP